MMLNTRTIAIHRITCTLYVTFFCSDVTNPPVPFGILEWNRESLGMRLGKKNSHSENKDEQPSQPGHIVAIKTLTEDIKVTRGHFFSCINSRIL